jgi:hypothetical protein
MQISLIWMPETIVVEQMPGAHIGGYACAYGYTLASAIKVPSSV